MHPNNRLRTKAAADVETVINRNLPLPKHVTKLFFVSERGAKELPRGGRGVGAKIRRRSFFSWMTERSGRALEKSLKICAAANQGVEGGARRISSDYQIFLTVFCAFDPSGSARQQILERCAADQIPAAEAVLGIVTEK